MLHEAGVSVYIQNLGIYTLNATGEANPIASIMVTVLAEMANIERSKFTTREVLQKYSLGSSANVATIKRALIKKELIDVENKQVVISDHL